MNKRKLTTILTVVDVGGLIALIICFLYRFSLVISFAPNVKLGVPGQFTTYSFLDGVIKINLIFVIGIFIVLLFLKFQKVEKVCKGLKLLLIILLVLFITVNSIHLALYDLKFYVKREIAGTIDEDFEPVPDEYERYCPYFDKMNAITDFDVAYECIIGETPLGKYLCMKTWCYDLGISFKYEEIYTKSPLLINQFITTKGEPSWINENEEKVYMESIQNKKYDCSVYSHEDFYEIWFVEKNNCVIIRYEKFGEFFNVSEEDILKDAQYLYDSLKNGDINNTGDGSMSRFEQS